MVVKEALLAASNDGEDVKRKRVPAIERAVVVLEALAAAQQPLTFSDLSRQVPLARSSLHDVISTLVATGMVDKTVEGRYGVGLKVVELARSRLSATELVSAFRRASEQLGAPEETVVLSVLSGADVIYLSFIDGRRPLAVRYEIGMRLPAAFTASGKAILASLPDDEVRSLVGDMATNPNGAQGTKTLDELIEELAVTRRRGFSVDDEEIALGMACVGAPIFTAGETRAVGAVALSLVKSVRDWLDDESSTYARRLAVAMTRELGGKPGWASLAQPTG